MFEQHVLIPLQQFLQEQHGLAQQFPLFFFFGFDFPPQHLLPSQHLGLLHLHLQHLKRFPQHLLHLHELPLQQHNFENMEGFCGEFDFLQHLQHPQQKIKLKNLHKAEKNLLIFPCFGSFAGTSPLGHL